MNKPAIILSGIAVASIVAIALYSPLSQENSAQPIVGQFVQPAHAQEVLAQAESQIVEMSDGDKKVLDELFKGEVDTLLNEAKQAPDLKILSADEVTQLEQRVLRSSTITIMSGSGKNVAEYVNDAGQLDHNLTILSYTGDGEVFLAFDEMKLPIFRLVVRQ